MGTNGQFCYMDFKITAEVNLVKLEVNGPCNKYFISSMNLNSKSVENLKWKWLGTCGKWSQGTRRTFCSFFGIYDASFFLIQYQSNDVFKVVIRN